LTAQPSKPIQPKILTARPLLALFGLGMAFFLLDKIAGRSRNQRFFRAEFATDLIYFLTAPLTKTIVKSLILVPTAPFGTSFSALIVCRKTHSQRLLELMRQCRRAFSGKSRNPSLCCSPGVNETPEHESFLE